MVDLVGHFLLFMVAAIGFLMVPLLIGKFVRPKLPTPEKDAIYECGEPTIGTSYIQFDLRFYVVALLFIIFDVEVAFFFPWATIYGASIQLADPNLSEAARLALSESLLGPLATVGEAISADLAHTIALFGFVDILVFFGVLLVGFAYVWKRGDLDWVRGRRASQESLRPPANAPPSPTPIPATSETPRTRGRLKFFSSAPSVKLWSLPALETDPERKPSHEHIRNPPAPARTIRPSQNHRGQSGSDRPVG